MLKIYHAKNTRSVRVVWLCEELGIPYELKPLNFSPDDLQSAELSGGSSARQGPGNRR